MYLILYHNEIYISPASETQLFPVILSVADKDLAVCRNALWSGTEDVRSLLEDGVVLQMAVAAWVVGEADCARVGFAAVDAVAAVRAEHVFATRVARVALAELLWCEPLASVLSDLFVWFEATCGLCSC